MSHSPIPALFTRDAASKQPAPAQFDPRAALRLVSRTFALSIEQLPAMMREATTLAYLAFRVSDFLEDNLTMPADQKVALLNLWVQVLDGQIDVEALTGRLENVDPNDPEALVAKHAGRGAGLHPPAAA